MLCGLNNYKCLIHDQERNECCMSFERMPWAKMPIISTVIKTVTISLLCQNSKSVGASRHQAFNFDKISSVRPSVHLGWINVYWNIFIFLHWNIFIRLLIVVGEWRSFKNISALNVTCHLLWGTKYFGFQRKVAGVTVLVLEFKATLIL